MASNIWIFLVLFLLSSLVNNAKAEWYFHGRDITNRREAVDEIRINRRSVSRLQLKWKFLAGFDISATPAVSNGAVYFPSWNGNLYAVNATCGTLLWTQNLTRLTGITVPGPNANVTVSRATPAVAGDLLILGINGPAYVIAVNRSSGRLAWLTLLDSNPLHVITMSGTVYRRGFFIGISSLELILPPEQCCTFRGSLAKLDVNTGKVLWQTYTLPDNGGKLGGYAGAGVWGSSPSIDTARGHVYVGTGQLYIAPEDVLKCQAEQNNQTKPPKNHQEPCYGPDAHFNSIVAFDVESGRIVWAKQLGGYDVFTLVCLNSSNPDCPPGPNLDADFGEAPMLLTIKQHGRLRDIAVAVQKSGFAWALDRANGDIVWSTKAGPGSASGGGIWGAATDGKRVYTNIANRDQLNFTLKPSAQNTTAGGWVAMDAATGDILWTTANPSNDTADGPVTIINDVMFAGSVASTGPVYAMDARDGSVLWSYNTGASVYGGASSSYGCVYIGHGYSVGLVASLNGWTSGKYLFAFCV